MIDIVLAILLMIVTSSVFWVVVIVCAILFWLVWRAGRRTYEEIERDRRWAKGQKAAAHQRHQEIERLKKMMGEKQ